MAIEKLTTEAEALYDVAEVELKAVAASPVITVSQCESMYRQYNLSSPVSGTATAVRAAQEFMRVARMLEAVQWP